MALMDLLKTASKTALMPDVYVGAYSFCAGWAINAGEQVSAAPYIAVGVGLSVIRGIHGAVASSRYYAKEEGNPRNGLDTFLESELTQCMIAPNNYDEGPPYHPIVEGLKDCAEKALVVAGTVAVMGGLGVASHGLFGDVVQEFLETYYS